MATAKEMMARGENSRNARLAEPAA